MSKINGRGGPGGKTHGMSGTAVYRIWTHMIDRCENPGHHAFDRYGGRGITVSPEWRASFLTFYEDIGPRPSPNHTLERRDNDGGYCRDNCYWATRREQQNNRCVNLLYTIDGETKTLAEWASYLGMPYTTLHNRARRGWPAHRIAEPKRPHNHRDRDSLHGMRSAG